MELRGDRELQKALAQAREAYPAAFAAALYRFGVAIASNALPRTPVEFGFLRASHYVSPPRDSKNPSVEVGFGTRYAVAQHQNTGYRHPRGGEAGFLWRAVQALAPQALKLIGADAARLAREGRGFGVERSGMPTRPRYGPEHPGATQKGRAKAARARAALRRRTKR